MLLFPGGFSQTVEAEKHVAAQTGGRKQLLDSVFTKSESRGSSAMTYFTHKAAQTSVFTFERRLARGHFELLSLREAFC